MGVPRVSTRWPRRLLLALLGTEVALALIWVIVRWRLSYESSMPGAWVESTVECGNIPKMSEEELSVAMVLLGMFCGG
jgi:hypothetical protein